MSSAFRMIVIPKGRSDWWYKEAISQENRREQTSRLSGNVWPLEYETILGLIANPDDKSVKGCALWLALELF